MANSFHKFFSETLLTEVSKDISQSLELKSCRLSHISNLLFHRLCTRHRRRFFAAQWLSATVDAATKQ